MLRAILRIITWAIIILMLCLVMLLAGVRVFGIDPYVVLSPSMGEAMPAGSMAYTVREQNFQVGDIVIWNPSIDDKGQEVRVTHRIVAIDKDKGTATTKGDANTSPDPGSVALKNLDGKVIWSIPILGAFAEWLHSTSGIFATIAFMIGLLFLIFLPNYIKKKNPEDIEEEEKEILSNAKHYKSVDEGKEDKDASKSKGADKKADKNSIFNPLWSAKKS